MTTIPRQSRAARSPRPLGAGRALRAAMACALAGAVSMGLAAGLVSIPLLFYSYTAVLGTNYLALDITVFLLSILLAFFLSGLTERKAAYPSGNRALFRVLPYLSMAAVLLLFALFVLFTFRTPRLPLFRDPVNGSFGI